MAMATGTWASGHMSPVAKCATCYRTTKVTIGVLPWRRSTVIKAGRLESVYRLTLHPPVNAPFGDSRRLG